jgi:hypothetical protein
MKRFLVATGCVSAAIVAIGFLLGAFIDELPSICLFRLATGRKCVFCGMLHAVAFAVRGDFAGARAAHSAWFIVLPSFIVFVAALITKRARLSWIVAGLLAIGTIWRQ